MKLLSMFRVCGFMSADAQHFGGLLVVRVCVRISRCVTGSIAAAKRFILHFFIWTFTGPGTRHLMKVIGVRVFVRRSPHCLRTAAAIRQLRRGSSGAMAPPPSWTSSGLSGWETEEFFFERSHPRGVRKNPHGNMFLRRRRDEQSLRGDCQRCTSGTRAKTTLWFKVQSFRFASLSGTHQQETDGRLRFCRLMMQVQKEDSGGAVTSSVNARETGLHSVISMPATYARAVDLIAPKSPFAPSPPHLSHESLTCLLVETDPDPHNTTQMISRMMLHSTALVALLLGVHSAGAADGGRRSTTWL